MGLALSIVCLFSASRDELHLVLPIMAETCSHWGLCQPQVLTPQLATSRNLTPTEAFPAAVTGNFSM